MLIDKEVEITRETIWIGERQYVRESKPGYHTNVRWYKPVSKNPYRLELITGDERDELEDKYVMNLN
jgi:hypothetical protein